MLSSVLAIYATITLVKLLYDKAVTVGELYTAAVWPWNLVVWIYNKIW
jgi:hypothetical protein